MIQSLSENHMLKSGVVVVSSLALVLFLLIRCQHVPCRAAPLPVPSSVLTTDVALLHDPSYLKWVKLYAEDEGALRHAFQHGEPQAGVLTRVVESQQLTTTHLVKQMSCVHVRWV